MTFGFGFRMLRRPYHVAVAVVAVAVIGGGILVAMGTGGPAGPAPTEPPVVRRITPEQYRAIVANIFGGAVTVDGRFDASLRVDGLLEVGASHVGVSPTGMEQYDIMARSVAEQVMAPKNRNVLLHCEPKVATEPDDGCARQFLSRSGVLLFRRPLEPAELDMYVNVARDAAAEVKDFYAGLSLSLAGMLTAPHFLFVKETLEKKPDRTGTYNIDAFSKASKLSFFLWNSAPDQRLIDLAERGGLDTKNEVAGEAKRMIASRRIEAGVRAFFSDMLQFDSFEDLSKDIVIYPKFSAQVASDAKEQTLKTIVDLLIAQHGDYRDLFTTKKTFLTKSLAAVYKVPLALNVPNGSPDGWRPYQFAPDDPRGGILVQASFVALHSHPGRSSPTIRGKALRELILCQKVPAPPGNVNFAILQDTSNPVYKTTRERLTAHRTAPACAGCHKIMDPIGLALEDFDGGGSFRTTENGVSIDTSGELDGENFADAAGLGKAVHDNPAASACLVQRMFSYAMGRTPSRSESTWLERLKAAFAEHNYAIPDLMFEIATSPEFYHAAPSAADRTAMLSTDGSFSEDTPR